MIEEGVATQSDGLTVAVRANEAQITLTQVDNGLSLAKMVLAQVCGMPIDSEFSLYDEVTPIENNTLTAQPVPLDMESVFANRNTESFSCRKDLPQQTKSRFLGYAANSCPHR